MHNDYDDSCGYQRCEEAQGHVELQLLPLILMELGLQLLQTDLLESLLGFLRRSRVLVEIRVVDGHHRDIARLLAVGVVYGGDGDLIGTRRNGGFVGCAV